MKKYLKENKGITLIALVITIIVLLILAGISIATLAGDNGILQKTITAKENTAKEQIKERIKLAYHAALAGGKGNYTKDTLMNELKNEFKTDYDVDDSDDKNWKMMAHGQEVIIPAGKKDNKEDKNVAIKVGTTNLKECSNLSSLYGEMTDFTSVEGVQWQLFYGDDDYIYLIASDYVPVSTLGEELNKESGDSTQKYKAWFATYDSGDFKGAIFENTPWSNGTESTTITNNTLTNKYLKWARNKTIKSPSMKAIAYMMDTSKWSTFAGEVEGAFAIGGPTLEMFVLSWNAFPEHSGATNQFGTYETINSTNSSTYGYKVKKGTESWAHYGKSEDLGNSTNMWCIHENGKALGMWIASPSSNYNDYVRIVDCGGYFSNYDSVDSEVNGFRPLVAIPKSSLK